MGFHENFDMFQRSMNVKVLRVSMATVLITLVTMLVIVRRDITEVIAKRVSLFFKRKF